MSYLFYIYLVEYYGVIIKINKLQMTLIDYQSKFNKIYANIPLALRGEIIAVVDNNPFTWNSAKIEIEQDTEIGKKIFTTLINTGIIKDDSK